MKKILLFSFFLMLGLVVSQFLPAMVGEGYSSVKTVSNTLLYGAQNEAYKTIY